MTSQISLLSNTSPTHSLPSIQTADGSCMPITHIGTVVTSNLSLPETYFVPSLALNLVSVGQLCDLGLTIIFSPHGCQVQDLQTGQILGTGRKVGRLFELTSLRLSLPKQICASTTIPLMYQWHLRLGHASASKLRSLVSNGSLGLSKFESFNCLHY